MYELNLLKFHEKSVNEIHRIIMSGESPAIAQSDNGEEAPAGKISYNIKLRFAAYGALLAAGISIIVFLFILNGQEPEKTYVTQVKKVVVKEKSEGRPKDEMEKQGYTRFGEVFFVEEVDNETDNKTDNGTVDNMTMAMAANKTVEKPKKAAPGLENIKKEPAPRKIEVTREKFLNKPRPKPKPPYYMKGNYFMIFEKVDKGGYARLKNIAKSKGYKLTASVLGSTKIKVWNLYRIDPKGNRTLAGRKVKYLRKFYDKAKVLTYAKSNKIPAVISTAVETSNIYNAKLCCMSVSAAKSIAKTGGVGNKVTRIKRGKP